MPLAAGRAAAQDAGIVGQVVDESGAILPGVSVTARSPSLQVPEVTAVTDERGEYRLTPLPIGTYEVTYELTGFQTVRREGLRLTSGFTAKVDITLGLGGLQESVTVSGASPVVDVTATSTSTRLTAEMLETTPTGRVGFFALLQQAPGVRNAIDIGGSSANANALTFRSFGQSGEAWQTLEGILTASAKTGQSGNYFDYASVEEARVQTVGADASMPLRGVMMDVIVKSGSNQFRSTHLVAAHELRLSEQQSRRCSCGRRGSPTRPTCARGGRSAPTSGAESSRTSSGSTSAPRAT